VAPVPSNLVDALAPGSAVKPNIFVIVIDSLRRDYLTPYNKSVDFTPNIAEFARQSVVMEHAFTRYGGTGLSEPSIWIGGMTLHKQYVTPFAPMNSLQKLLDVEKYRSYVSRDSILQTVVSPFPGLVELDTDRTGMDYDTCSSLEDLQGKIAAAPNAPMLLYTQSQNIHISVINRQGGKSIDDANYHGFYPPYASRLRRIDGCFGKFIGFLKARNIFDSSIVILTADHGDSLGEEGRWGHAYTIYPEILRIPLLIHLPPEIRQKYQVNTAAVAFSTDITPSLYYLLGHRPIKAQEMFGRPLFTERIEEQSPYHRDSFLVASSYAPVYGILGGDGRSLYVSDAVNYKDYAFDLTTDPPAAQTITSSMKADFQKLIRKRVTDIGALFHFASGPASQGVESKTAMLHPAPPAK
jgi:arylsulfatase A-like enzyme